MSPGAQARRRRVGLLAGLVIPAVLLFLPPPAGLPPAGWRTAAIAVLMATWWISEAIPIPATALAPLVLFPLLGIAPIGPVAAPYANPVIFLFLGGFLIAAGLEACGLHRRIALVILNAVGPRPARVVGGFMVAVAFVSMWVSNTATVAMFLPLAVSVADLVDRSAGPGPEAANFGTALMLGTAYAASLGGIGTLIGTPPNALLAGFMEESYGRPIGFGQWMLVGVPLVLVSLPIAWFLLVRLFFPIHFPEVPGGRALLREELAGLGKPTREEAIVGAIGLMAAAAWVARPALERVIPGLSDPGIALAAGLALFMVPSARRRGGRTLDWERMRGLPWGVLLLFGGGLALADAIQGSGLAGWMGVGLEAARALPPIVVVLLVTTLLVFLTELTSNTAITAAFLPVAGALALAIGVDPIFLAAPAAIGGSCAFMLPVATPPNAMVYATGRIAMGQMMRSGFWLNLVMIVLVTAVASVAAAVLRSP
ncbi:MAG TPA: SLC13 family permease [Gemmatimonadales bacterium]|nr:SLC13 family permease [Gemmatimonadales bacterium]